jgi:ketosteroid isomerase-like protein
MTNTLRKLILAVSLLGGVAAPAAALANGTVGREHRAAIDSFRSAQVRGYLGGGADGMLPPLADSIQLMPGYQKTVVGKADVATYHQAFLKRFTVSAYDREPIEVADLGTRVMEIGRFTMTVAMKGSAESHTLRGKYLDLWEKSPTGKLELNTAAWNYDENPKIAEQLRFAEVPSVHLALQGRVPVTAGINFELAALQKLEESVIAQHDGKTWALFYADDGILLANQGTVVSGRKALDEYTEKHVKVLPLFEKLDLRTHRIDDLGEYVIEYCSGVVTWKVNEYSGVNLGKGILIWRRANGGALRKWRAISMYD